MPKKKKPKKHWSDALVRMGACREAVIWCRQFKTQQAAWDACKSPYWMDWVCGILQVYWRAGLHPVHCPLASKQYRAWLAVRASTVRRLYPKAPRIPKEYRNG